MTQSGAADDILELATLRRLIASGDAKRLRETNRLSLSEMGRACGVDRSTVSRWERSRLVPRGDGATRYAQVLARLMELQVSGTAQ